MKSTAEIKFDDIVIASEHLKVYDPNRCKNALWSIYNVIKKAKKVSTEYWTWEYTKLSTLYAMGKQALFLDENMKTLVLYEGDVKVHFTDKKDLTKSGFTISKKDGKTAFSYKLDDFNNVIFGLKLFVDVCEKYAAGGFAEQLFHYGDISIAFKGADIQAKEKEVQQVIAYDIGIRGTLSEEKFDVISEDDKAFIFAYDDALSPLGYDFGNRLWGATSYTEVGYSKTGVKSKNMVSRIRIEHDTGKITLRIYVNNVDKYRDFIENAPLHIKAGFAFESGECTGCNINFCHPKKYTLDGKQYVKCVHFAGTFNEPTIDKIPDYCDLLATAFPKKSK